jgi:hypothetical protein
MEVTDKFPTVDIPVYWSDVLVRGNHFRWHDQRLSERARQQIAGPRVYRWVLRLGNGEVVSYIGQTEDFERRLRSYRVGSTSNRHSHVRAAIQECASGGGTVGLCFLDLETGGFWMYGRLINRRSLTDHEVRMMMEGVAILKALADGEKLLNRLRRNAVELMMVRHLRQHPPDVLKSVLEQMQRSLPT